MDPSAPAATPSSAASLSEGSHIEILTPPALERHRADLAALLIDTVADGAAVGFMHPLAPGRADAFWRGVGAEAAAGDRLVLAALEEGRPLGTVQLVLALPENQPHRCEIAKMMVAPRARRRGLGRALMAAALEAARAAGRELVTLDTRSGDPSQALYAAMGFSRAGEIPGYALDPDGRARHGTTLMYRAL